MLPYGTFSHQVRGPAGRVHLVCKHVTVASRKGRVYLLCARVNVVRQTYCVILVCSRGSHDLRIVLLYCS